MARGTRTGSVELAALDAKENELVQEEQKFRFVGIDGETMQKYPNNSIVNTKYNVLTFIPLVLFSFPIDEYPSPLLILSSVPIVLSSSPIYEYRSPLGLPNPL